MTRRTPEGALLCALAWRRPGRPVWLALDLPGAVRVHEIGDPDHDPALGPGTVLIAGTGSECRELGGGGLLVGGGALWSLLDPGQPRAPAPDDDEDGIAIETVLRQGARRFVERVRWYRQLDQALRDAVRRDLSFGHPSLAPLLDHLEQVALPPVEPVAAAESTPPDAARVPRPCPGDPDGIHAWLCDTEGLGAVYGDKWSPRSEQATMAREVALALQRREPLLVEAGTGVGKTLAYLVPLAAAAAQGRRAVVSTHTRALQSQVLSQDLPRLQPLLGEKRFRLLMGRRNYLCLRQERAFLTRPVEDLADGLRTAALRLWLAVTSEGLREELADHPVLQPCLAELFDAADLCLPGLCWETDRCHVQRARRRAREADILVVNHALLLHDLRQGGTLLGEYDALVIDEAHRLPAVTLETHSVACGLRRLTDLDDALGAAPAGGIPPRLELAARRLEARGPAGERAAAACTDCGRALVRMQTSFRRWWQGVGEQMTQLPGAAQSDIGRVRLRDTEAYFAPLRPQTAALLEDAAAAAAAQAMVGTAVGDLDDLEPALQDDLAQVAMAGQILRLLEHDVAFLTGAPDEGWVTWIEPSRQRAAAGRPGVALLGATLLEAGSVLREAWQEADLRPIVTSATLAVGEDFTHMLDELGLSRRRPSTRTLSCPSPFDYREQCRILVPARFADPGSPGFDEAVGGVLAALARGVPRKTMALFTSYRAIRVAQEVLAAHGFDASGAGGGPVVLAQGPRQPAAAVGEQFRRLPRAILLGTATFWEGVDFPGDDLEVLIVAKLPFLVPSDPWVEARCERLQAMGENPFTSFMVRDAVLRLRQGFGRLIRRTGDRGVVLILDNRLHTKNYGNTFLGALPTLPATYGDEADLLARVDAFFSRPAAREQP
ncbi:MAG: DEAD/DEAH box helicase [bacterium]|nr:DEAD/DEAH box helicase [bacterium]